MSVDSKILLGKILQRFADRKVAKVDGYSSFGYLRETLNSVWVTRERGLDTQIPFAIILKGIDTFKTDPSLYDEGPTQLRKNADIKYITSPVWSLLHLLEKEEFE